MTHPIIQRRQEEQRAKIELAAEWVRSLSGRIDVIAAVVFGSTARGDFNKWSDIDVLVVAAVLPAGARQRLDLLMLDAPPGVQPIAWTPDEYARRRERGDPIVSECETAGVVLWGGVPRRRGPASELSMRIDQAMALLSAFEREGVRYVLIGSMAMAAQGLIRATRDIDFFIAADQDKVERVKAALRSVFDDTSIDEISSDELSGPYPVVRYGPPGADYVIGLLARLGDAFGFTDIESEELVIEGVRVRVATPRMLYEMKRDTVRARDRVDAESLKEKFGLTEGASD